METSADLSKRQPVSKHAATLVSVCIVNYNNRELLARCLESVFAQSRDVQFEVLVADNGSTDDSLTWLKREHPDVRLFENTNIGFSRANNQLIRHARGSMILLLNNDCVLGKDTIQELLALMETDPKIGIVGCRILTADGILQPTFSTISPRQFFFPSPVERYQTNLLTFGKDRDRRIRIMKSYEVRHGYDRLLEVDWLSGVCILIRCEVFDTIGALDENFFMYYEDIDFCLRARKVGWRVMYTPSASALHFVRRLSEKRSADRLMTEARLGQYYFVRKHFGRSWAGLLLLRYLLQLLISPLFAFGRVFRALLQRRPFSPRLGWQTEALRRILVDRGECRP